LSSFNLENLAFHPSLFEGATVCLFEDDDVEADLFPLTVLRPVWDMLVGTGTIIDHVQRASEMSPQLRPRTHLQRLCDELWPDAVRSTEREDVVFLNGRVFELRPEQTHDFVPLPETAVDDEGRLLFARRSATIARRLLADGGNNLAELLVQQGGVSALPAGWRCRIARHVWDPMLANADLLQAQLGASNDAFLGARPLRDPGPGVDVCSRLSGAPIFVGPEVKIHPGVVLGNHTGAIFIGAGTEILPHSYLEGPLFVGSHCLIKAGARLYSGSSFGPVCKLGGEITQSIIQGYSNKQHDGFLGHAHLGQWVNIGAGTNNSDLKNNYESVHVEVGGRYLDTGHRHIGCFIGDHTKTGINTMFNTGTVVGVACNLFGAGFPQRFVPSFHWGGAERLLPVPLSRTLETARAMMARREKVLSEAAEELMRRHYEFIVKKERRA